LGVNGGVNLSHEADGFGQGDNDLLIMVEVFKGEGPALAVLEPFVPNFISPFERLKVKIFDWDRLCGRSKLRH
jgi:hypothetical protein